MKHLNILKAFLIFFVFFLIGVVFYHFLFREDTKIKETEDTKGIIEISKDFLIKSTSLGKEEDLTIENFYNMSEYYSNVRKSACDGVLEYLSDSNITLCDNLESIEYLADYSEYFTITYPVKVEITEVRDNGTDIIEVYADIDIDVYFLEQLAGDEIENIPYNIRHKKEPIHFDNVRLIMNKRDGKYRVTDYSYLSNTLKSLFALWEQDSTIDNLFGSDYEDVKMLYEKGMNDE